MDQSSSQTIATFTGTLLRRERNAERKLVQLVFREGEQDWLCISNKLADAKLALGKEYRIEGIFKQIGDRPFIHEPNISLVKQRSIAVIIGLGIGFVLFLTGGSVAAYTMLSKHNLPAAQNTTSDASQSTSIQTGDNSPAETPADTTPSPTASTPTPSPATTTTTKKKTTPSTTTPPVNNPVVVPPTPDCDAPQATPFQTNTVYDPNQTDGTVTQQGVEGSQQTCYPNGRSQPGQTTVTQQPTDQIVTTTTNPNP